MDEHPGSIENCPQWLLAFCAFVCQPFVLASELAEAGRFYHAELKRRKRAKKSE